METTPLKFCIGAIDEVGDDPEWSLVSEELVTRSQVLSRFTLALAYEVRGDPKRALQEFDGIERDFDTSWGEGQGKEVLYLFIGREAQLAGQDTEALGALQRALTLNPAYARVYAGLGNHFYNATDRLPPADRLKGPEIVCPIESSIRVLPLDCAVRMYQKAMELAPGSPAARLNLKANLGLTNTFRSQAEAYVHVGDTELASLMLDQAMKNAQAAIVAADEGDVRSVTHLELAFGSVEQLQAYLSRVKGDSELSSRQYRGAIDHYQRCVDLARAQSNDWFLHQIESYCFNYQQAAQLSLAQVTELALHPSSAELPVFLPIDPESVVDTTP